MKIEHYNSKLAHLILPKNYATITLFGHIFFKKEKDKVSNKTLNHEYIHVEQQKECFWLGFGFGILVLIFTDIIWLSLLMPFVFFYLWYGIEYLIGLFIHKFNPKKAYYSISFEKEAHDNDEDEYYLKFIRDSYDWMFYLGNNKKEQ